MIEGLQIDNVGGVVEYRAYGFGVVTTETLRDGKTVAYGDYELFSALWKEYIDKKYIYVGEVINKKER